MTTVIYGTLLREFRKLSSFSFGHFTYILLFMPGGLDPWRMLLESGYCSVYIRLWVFSMTSSECQEFIYMEER